MSSYLYMCVKPCLAVVFCGFINQQLLCSIECSYWMHLRDRGGMRSVGKAAECCVCNIVMKTLPS